MAVAAFFAVERHEVAADVIGQRADRLRWNLPPAAHPGRPRVYTALGNRFEIRQDALAQAQVAV